MTAIDDPTTPAPDELDHRSGPALSWLRVIVLVTACAFLAGAAVYFVENRPVSSASVDAGFYRDMIFHHDQAVEMSLIELGAGEDPVVRRFAQEIVLFQRYEIGRMDEQLRQWGIGHHDDGDTAMAWMDAPVPVREMPGLATDEQMDALRAACGAEADELFLDLMAEHHRAGALMAEHAADHADDDGVRDLARVMARNQSIEINEFAADRRASRVRRRDSPIRVGGGPRRPRVTETPVRPRCDPSQPVGPFEAPVQGEAHEHGQREDDGVPVLILELGHLSKFIP